MLRIENLIKKYGDHEALKGVTIKISKGEVLAVIGPSGSGKTTLLRLIAGFERPDQGRIVIDNKEVSTPIKMIVPHQRRLSMVFQDLALWPHMTVTQHLAFVLKNKHSQNHRQTRIDDILRSVSLIGFNNRYPHELSGGEKQRLAIARAIASQPEYLLMDEPFSNLDPIVKRELQAMVLELKNNTGIGIIYVTHIVQEAALLADRIAVMNEGIFEQIGDKDKILTNSDNEFIRRLIGAEVF